MQKLRLLRLARLLEKNASNPVGVKFDLNGWGRSDDESRRLDCGTTACAVGLACISGEFLQEGLTLDENRALQVSRITPKYKGLFGFDAVGDFFGVEGDELTWLFLASSYPIAKGAQAERAVAKRLRSFVAGKASPPRGNA